MVSGPSVRPRSARFVAVLQGESLWTSVRELPRTRAATARGWHDDHQSNWRVRSGNIDLLGRGQCVEVVPFVVEFEVAVPRLTPASSYVFGRPPIHSNDKGTTTMKKNYQTTDHAAAIGVPDTIAVAMTYLAEELREGLLALAVGTGLQVMDAILEESVTALSSRIASM